MYDRYSEWVYNNCMVYHNCWQIVMFNTNVLEMANIPHCEPTPEHEDYISLGSFFFDVRSIASNKVDKIHIYAL